MKLNIKIKTKGLTKEERKILLNTVRKMAIKRRRDNMPSLRYKIKANEEETVSRNTHHEEEAVGFNTHYVKEKYGQMHGNTKFELKTGRARVVVEGDVMETANTVFLRPGKTRILDVKFIDEIGGETR